MNGIVEGWPRKILMIEGFAVLTLSVYFYAQTDLGWGLFALLILAPDIAFLAYLAGPRFGAFGYNVLHTYFAPAALYAAALLLKLPEMIPFALIWSAHIGMDRMLGYGLKYATSFGSTHLGAKQQKSG